MNTIQLWPDFPPDWDLHPLRRICRLDARTLADDTPADITIRYIDIGNVQQGRIDQPQPMVFGSAPSRARRVVRRGDVIVSTVRTYLKAVAIIDEDADDLVVSTGFAVLSPGQTVCSRFLWYAAQSEPFISDVVRHSEGVSYPAIPPERFAKLRVPVPPLAVQGRIADFLDREMANIDALIQKKKLLTELLATEAENTVDSAIGECAQSAERLTLRRVVRRFVDYRGQTPSKTVSGVPLVTARNIRNGRIAFEESEEFIAEEDYGRWMVRGIPDRGDVLLTTEAPLGEVALVEDPKIALAQPIILLKVDPGRILSKFLWCYFRSNLGRMELETRATGSTAIGIKASHLRAVPIIVPSLQRQLEIVGAYEAKLNSSARLISEIEGAIDRLGEYRAALITAAVTGQIDVRDRGCGRFLNGVRAD